MGTKTSKKECIGKCAICGEIKPLTKEHIPPKVAFNNGKVHIYPAHHNLGTGKLPFDYEEEKPRYKQNGMTLKTLCKECNEYTGGFYGEGYGDFIKKIDLGMRKVKLDEVDGVYGLEGIIKNIYPLRIIKQILSMFCSVNIDFDGIDEIRKFVKDKESNTFDENKYKIETYLYSSNMCKVLPMVKEIKHTLNLKDLKDLTKCPAIEKSEIVTYPLGYILYINPPTNLDDKLVDLTHFTKCEFDYKCDLEMIIPIHERNTDYIGDFRSKNDIINAINRTNNDN